MEVVPNPLNLLYKYNIFDNFIKWLAKMYIKMGFIKILAKTNIFYLITQIIMIIKQLIDYIAQCLAT